MELELSDVKVFDSKIIKISNRLTWQIFDAINIYLVMNNYTMLNGPSKWYSALIAIVGNKVEYNEQ